MTDDFDRLEAIKTKAAALAEEINANDPDLTMIYIVHNHGQLQSAMHMVEDSFMDHPAGRIASSISTRIFPAHEPSAFHGLCVKTGHGMMGLRPFTSYLAVISINADQYDDFYDASCDLYRQTWQALELTALMRAQPPEKTPDRPLNIKRSPLGDTRVNLRSDIFAMFFMLGDGHDDALKRMAYTRSIEMLTRIVGHNPERYPFPMIAEASAFAITDVLSYLSADKSRLEHYTELAIELADSVSDDQIKLWHRLCEMSQEMAWRGYKPETIMGAAIHTSDDAYLRSVMHTVGEFADIQPQDLDQIQAYYNAFIGIESNRSVHQTMVDHTFEITLPRCNASGSTAPFFEIAEAQNMDLLQGRFMGWCAFALQSAADVYSTTDSAYITPAQAARVGFEGQSHVPGIGPLYRLTKEIIAHRHKGEALTLEDVISLARSLGDMEVVARAIEHTLHYRNQTATHQKSSYNNDDLEMTSNIVDESLAIKLSQQAAKPAQYASDDHEMGSPDQPTKEPPAPTFVLED